MSSERIASGRFLAPTYWPVWLGIGVIGAVSKLPYRLGMRSGRAIGRLLGVIARRRARVGRLNLALCFPNLGEEERERLLSRCFQSLGQGLVETAYAWFAPSDRLRPLIREVKGEEHLEQALAGGHGAILLCAHFSHMDMSGRLFALRRPMAAVYKPNRNPLFETFMRRSRNLHARTVAMDETRALVRALKDGLALWYAPDQYFRGTHRVFVPFFGVPAATNGATGRLAAIAKAPMLSYCVERLAGDAGYRLIFGPVMEGFPTGDPEEDASRVNAEIETMVRGQPEHYLWVHRRFNRLPDGSKRTY